MGGADVVTFSASAPFDALTTCSITSLFIGNPKFKSYYVHTEVKWPLRYEEAYRLYGIARLSCVLTLSFKFWKDQFIVTGDFEGSVAADFTRDGCIWYPSQNFIAQLKGAWGVPSPAAVFNIYRYLSHRLNNNARSDLNHFTSHTFLLLRGNWNKLKFIY